MPSYLPGTPQKGATPQYDSTTGQLVGYTFDALGGKFLPSTQTSLSPPGQGIETFAPSISLPAQTAPAAAAPAAQPQGAQAPTNPGPGTNGILVGSKFVDAANVDGLKAIVQQAPNNAQMANLLNQLATQFGVSPAMLSQQVGASSPISQVQGSNGQTMFLSPQGQYFTVGSNGQRIAATQQQLQSGQFPTIAGYDSSGNAYYAQPQPQSAAQASLAKAQAAAPTPEAAAFQSAAATDPTMAGIIQQLGSYYKGQQATTAPGSQAVPDLQKTYLNQQDKIDPQSAQNRNQLGQTYLTDLTNANQGQLPSGVANQVQEAARTAQTARGNALGTAQASQEAMATGLTGLQIKQQAEQNAQSWLSSGLTSGQQSAALYDWRTGMSNQANQGANSYLSSGQTPYGVGTNQLANVANQATSSQQGTQYSPSYQGGPNFSYINPQAGQDFSTGSNNWYNSQTNTQLGVGALQNQQQANTFGLIGSALKAVGSIAGGAMGACWVAREAFGEDDLRWLLFRDWMLNDAPEEFRGFYLKNGPEIAKAIKHQPMVKELIAHLMQEIINNGIPSSKE